MSKEEDFQSILENGISFGRGGDRRDPNEGKVKTKRNTVLQNLLEV